jgi:hypothetical protein
MLRNEIFIAHSHEDEHWMREMHRHLHQLRHLEIISTWSDRNIILGTEWRTELEQTLPASRVVVFWSANRFHIESDS